MSRDLFSDAARAQESREASRQRARIVELLEQIVALLTPSDKSDDD